MKTKSAIKFVKLCYRQANGKSSTKKIIDFCTHSCIVFAVILQP